MFLTCSMRMCHLNYFILFFATGLLISSCNPNILEIKNYSNIYPYQDNYALVEYEGKFGIIDTSFKEIIKPDIDEVIYYDHSPYFFDSCLYGIRKDSILIYDTAGILLHHYKLDKRLKPNLLSNQGFQIDSLSIKTSNDTYYYTGNHDWGCLNSQGDTIIPFVYDKIVKGLNNSFIATKGDVKNLHTTVYSTNGDTLRRSYNVPIHSWEKQEQYWMIYPYGVELLDKNFELLKKTNFTDVLVSGEYAWIKKGSWVLIDSSLTEIGDYYDDVWLNKYWGVIWKNKKVAISNLKGEIITPFIYEGVIADYVSNSKRIVAKTADAIHILNQDGKLLKILEGE